MSAVNDKSIKPVVLWAQREDRLFITVEIWDIVEEDVQLTESMISFSGKKGDTKQQYGFSLEFYEKVKPETMVQHVSGRAIFITVEKNEECMGWWPRLQSGKEKLSFLKTDFSRWVDPEEGEEEHADGFGRPGAEQFGDFSNFGDDMDYKDDFAAEDDDEVEIEEPLDTHIKSKFSEESDAASSREQEQSV